VSGDEGCGCENGESAGRNLGDSDRPTDFYSQFTITIRDVKRSLNFRTSILKFEFDLHTFGI